MKTLLSLLGLLDVATPRTLSLSVTEKGFKPKSFKPDQLQLKQGKPVRLVVTPTTDHTRATAASNRSALPRSVSCFIGRTTHLQAGCASSPHG